MQGHTAWIVWEVLEIQILSGTDTFSGEATLQESFYLPSEREENLYPFRVHPFSDGDLVRR